MSTFSNPAQFEYADYYDIWDSRNNPHTSVISNQHYRASPFAGAVDLKTGTNNPGWRDRIAKRLDASSAYTRKVFLEITPTVTRAQSRTLPTGITSNYLIESFARTQGIVGSVQLPPLDDTGLQDLALQRLKNKLREHTGSANVLAPLAECRELKELIHNASGYTYNFLQGLVDLRKKGWDWKSRTRRARKAWRDAWYGWNFGIAPMVHDIDQAGKAIASFIARQDSSYAIHGTASRTGLKGYDPGNTSISPAFGLKVVSAGSCTYNLSYRYAGSFHSKLLSSNDYSVFNHLGIDLSQVPYTLWELTGFSWIADYFANIGEFLEDSFYCPPGNLTYLTLTRRVTVTADHFATYIVAPGNPNNVSMTYCKPGIAHIVYREVQRQVLTTLPHVGLHFKSVDRIGSSANVIPKLLNLVSLLV